MECVPGCPVADWISGTSAGDRTKGTFGTGSRELDFVWGRLQTWLLWQWRMFRSHVNTKNKEGGCV